MASNSGKVPKVKKQAIYEVNVVKACRDEYLEKLNELQKKIDEEKIKETILLERGKLSSSISDKECIAREIKSIRDILRIMNADYECFRDNVDMFNQLLTLLDSFFRHERFRYIVKKIPEKKLPDMVRDPDKRAEVGDLLLSLFDEFQTAYHKYLLDAKDRHQKHERARKIDENFRERNEKPDKELASILTELGASKTAELITEEATTEDKPNPNRNDN